MKSRILKCADTGGGGRGGGREGGRERKTSNTA